MSEQGGRDHWLQVDGRSLSLEDVKAVARDMRPVHLADRARSGIEAARAVVDQIVADGTPEAAARLNRVLTNDPGTGVLRHVDAGYERAVLFARTHSMNVPIWPEETGE